MGLLAVQCAQFRGAKRVILIDNAKYRLEFAAQKLPGVELLDFGEHDTVKRLKEMVPNGPDVCIECVGFHYAKSLMSKVEMAVGLQTDPADMINELIVSCRKVRRHSASCLIQHITCIINYAMVVCGYQIGPMGFVTAAKVGQVLPAAECCCCCLTQRHVQLAQHANGMLHPVESFKFCKSPGPSTWHQLYGRLAWHAQHSFPKQLRGMLRIDQKHCFSCRGVSCPLWGCTLQPAITS